LAFDGGIMRIVKAFLFLFSFIPGLVLAATCSTSPGLSAIALSGKITVPRDAAPGSPIGPVYGPYNGGVGAISCNSIANLYISFDSVQTLSPFNDVYTTNIPGIGVKVWSTYRDYKTVGNDRRFYYTNNASSGNGWLAAVYLQFYVTSNIVQEGIISLSTPFVKAMAGDNSAVYSRLSFNSSVSVVLEKGCEVSVDSNNQTVILSDVRMATLKNNVGRYPMGKSFSIGLNCTPETKVSMKFEGATMKDNANVLANETVTDSAGASVGIQIYHNNAAVNFGEAFLVSSKSMPFETLPFSAHYYYNGGAEIQGGNVNAVTSFTLTYE
jgi:major type 1 subunit fimbrin (pilin)